MWLDGALLGKGDDRLSSHGAHRLPGRRKEAGAVDAARHAIESLRDMAEQ